MSTKLNGIEVSAHYNGVGLHDTPGAETATWDYAQAIAHAQDLRAHGVTLYKLFGSGTKGQRARAYRDNGILVVHRWWPGGAHWGRPPGEWLMPPADYNYLLDCGVSLFEPGWNEFNIADEWAVPIPDAAAIARAVLDAWETAGSWYGGFGHLLFPSNTPGGHVDHRACYRAIVAEIARRGLAGTIKHIAIHPRPLNNPPWVTWTATNTCTFDEWRWIREQFASVGVNAYYWATEHGYSIDYCENAEYPPINLQTWTDYNWQLFRQMDPEHPQAEGPDLAGLMYWYNAGWGHWGFWARDALVDSPAPEMPAPSPLWLRMGDRAQELAFTRYDGSEPVPIVRAQGLDVSQFSGTVNWDLVKAEGKYKFAFIRFSGPNADRTRCIVDVQAEANYAGAGAAGLLRGGYHGLMQEPTGQAKLFVDAVGGRPLELGYWGDFEGAVTDAKAGAFLEAADRNLAAWGVERPVCDVYTGLGWLSGKAAAWAPGRDLWLASWTYDPDSNPKVPVQWEGRGWAFLQYSNLGSVPGVPNRVCLDVFDGTEDELYEIYKPDGGENGGEEPSMDGIRVLDAGGTVRDWQWVLDEFGPLDLRLADPVDIGGSLQVIRLVQVQEQFGPANCNVHLFDINGQPVIGAGAAWWYSTAAGFSSDVLTLAKSLWETNGDIGLTNDTGVVGFAMSEDGKYYPDQGVAGPYGTWFLTAEHTSDGLFGVGMEAGTDHRHLNLWFQIVEVDQEKPPEPEDEDLAAILAELRAIRAAVEKIAGVYA